MQADKGGMYIMLMVIILVVGITVLNTILMAVLERQKEYGGQSFGTISSPAHISSAMIYGIENRVRNVRFQKSTKASSKETIYKTRGAGF